MCESDIDFRFPISDFGFLGGKMLPLGEAEGLKGAVIAVEDGLSVTLKQER